ARRAGAPMESCLAAISSREVEDRRHEDAEQDDIRGVRTELWSRRAPFVGEDHTQPDDEEDHRHEHGGLLFPPLSRNCLRFCPDRPNPSTPDRPNPASWDESCESDRFVLAFWESIKRLRRLLRRE